MWRIERCDGNGAWTTVMASPHRIGLDDIRGPPGPSPVNQTNGAFLMNDWPSPGNKSVFAGRRGWRARVCYDDTVVEVYDWAQVPENEFVPPDEMRYLWGWKLIERNTGKVPFEQLWPLSFVG